jgi:hypothetical protein
MPDIEDYCIYLFVCVSSDDRLCGLVVKLPGFRPRGPRFYSPRCQIFWVAVGPLRPCEDKWGTIWKKSSDSSLENWD